MFKKLFSVFLIVGLIVSTTPDLYAQKGGGGSRSSSSSGRSYSSGSSSRSSSSSSSGKSYSSGSSGKSYSSGSTSKGSGFSTTSSSGKGYSSGSSSSKQSGLSATSSSGKGYSSGSSKPSPAANPGNSGSIFGGGSKVSSNPAPASNPVASNVSADGKSKKPSGTTFNNSLSNSAKQSQSQKQFVAATTPKSTYKTPGPNGVQKPITTNTPQVSTVRNYVTHERYVTYDNRASGFYGGYYGHPMYYHDPYSPFLMGWLMSDALSSHDRATWMYHHQSDMDQTRYREMLAKDARLQAEIDQLKAQNLARDPSYVPAQMKDNPDLMFNKEFVDASYNPVETSSGVGYFFYYLFVTVVVLGLVGVVAYFLFIKEY